MCVTVPPGPLAPPSFIPPLLKLTNTPNNHVYKTTPLKTNQHTIAYKPTQHKQQAVDLLERAAELGDAPALNALAYLYQEGKGVDQDYGKAQTLFKQAALKVRVSCFVFCIGWVWGCINGSIHRRP